MSIEQVADAAKAAGFTGDALATAVAISGAETGGTFDAVTTADTRRYTELVGVKGQGDWYWTDPQTGEVLPDFVDPEYSVGPWQIDLLVHTDIAEATARDYDQAAAYVHELSQGGTDFTPWATYTGGEYRTYLEAASDILGVPYTPETGAQGQQGTSATGGPAPRLDGDGNPLPPEPSGDPPTEPLPFGDTEWTVIYESIKGAIPASGLPFHAELVDGHFTGDSTEEWTLRLTGRPR